MLSYCTKHHSVPAVCECHYLTARFKTYRL